jgi:septin 6/8/11
LGCWNLNHVIEGVTRVEQYLTQNLFTDTVHSHKSPGVEISEHIYNLKEGNVKLRLAIVDSVGYGDQINKENR